MITDFNGKRTKKDDVKLLIWIVIGFLLVAWLCTPPGNKFLQICFWGNNTKLIWAKLTSGYDTDEYIFHRNNAVYLAKMYPKDTKRALKEIDKAIKTIPSFAPERELMELYRDKANIELYAGQYKKALNDYERSGEIPFTEFLKVALLYKEVGNYRKALSYCNAILNVDNTAYAGFACLADVYVAANKPNIAIRVYNLAIDRKPSNARQYVDRGKIKQSMGYQQEAEADFAKAKELMPTIDMNESIIHDTLHPKILMLSIK